jgi:hypothetical protein
MKQRVLVALLTVLVFASGFLARVWTEGSPALPPPPAPIGSEFTPQPAAPNAPPATVAKRPFTVDRAQLIAAIQTLGPQITMFREKMAEIDAEFEREFSAILSDEQRQHRADAILAAQKKHAERTKFLTASSSTAPMTDDEILGRQSQPLYTVLQWVTVSAKLDSMTKENKLDAGQRARARELIEGRRTKFLLLVDSVTPPSILYSRLAPDVQRLAEPTK